MLARLIVSFAYFLESSKRYKRVKTSTYNLLENPRSKIKPLFDFFIIFLVILTVSILIYDVKNRLPYHFEVIENIAVSVFIFEWLGRFWISDNLRLRIINYYERKLELGEKPKLFTILKLIIVQKIQYTFSPMSIIDLLAILPAYRSFRILRIFLIFRLFKMFRYAKSLNSFLRILKDKKFELNFLFLLGISAVLLASIIMYVFEGGGENPKIHSFLDAIYWSAITISTVGYGDITPVTIAGRVITVFLVGGGFLILVLSTSVVTNALSEKISILRDEKVLSQVGKLTNLIVIFGFGRMGQVLAAQLKKSHKKFIVVDVSYENLAKARENDYFYLKADASNYDTVDSVVFKNDVKKVVLTTNNDALNLSILLTIKAKYKNMDVIARANSYENIKKFYIAKADHVIFPYQTVAEVAVEYIGNSVRFDAIDNILVQKDSITIDEILIPEGSDYIGKSIDEIGLNKFNITIISVLKEDSKEEFVFNPNSHNYKFQENDSLVLVGEEKDIFKIKDDILRQLI
ncbi:MAG: NAD-binding protein [Sulfurospirillum sp.]